MKVSSWDIPDVSESFASGCRVANTGLKNRSEPAIFLSMASKSRLTSILTCHTRRYPDMIAEFVRRFDQNADKS